MDTSKRGEHGRWVGMRIYREESVPEVESSLNLSLPPLEAPPDLVPQPARNQPVLAQAGNGFAQVPVQVHFPAGASLELG